jgi:hypothetical protein
VFSDVLDLLRRVPSHDLADALSGPEFVGQLDLVRRRVLPNSVLAGLAKRVVPVDRAGCCPDGLGEELKQLLLIDDPLTLHHVSIPFPKLLYESCYLWVFQEFTTLLFRGGL